MKRILYFESPEELTGLAEASFQLTPKVSSPLPKRVYLDITDTQKLFGGESATLSLAQNLAVSFSKKFTEVLTERPEWAMAIAVGDRVLLPPHQSQQFLYGLPLERLAFCGDPIEVEKEKDERESLVEFMRRVGMKRVGEFAHLSPLAILRRFGRFGILLHEWVLGKRECLLPPFAPEVVISEKIEAEEIFSLDQLIYLLNEVLQRLEGRLLGRRRLAKQLSLSFRVESGNHQNRTLSLAEPLYQKEALLKLISEFLRNTSWDSPLKSMELIVSDTVPYQPGQLSLFDTAENRFADLSQFTERLRAQFGEAHVGVFESQESHLPEKSWKLTWPPVVSNFKAMQRRPSFLYTPPKSIRPSSRWTLLPLENIFSEWWNQTVNRKYFRAITQTGEHLWLYFDTLQKQWFLHGVFD